MRRRTRWEISVFWQIADNPFRWFPNCTTTVIAASPITSKNRAANGPSGKRFEDFSPGDFDVIGYEFERGDIVGQNHMPFLYFWNTERIARAGCLHDMYGKIRFSVEGYDDDERGIAEIPETRKFLRGLAEQWPFFFYADDLKTDFLRVLIECMIPEVTFLTTASDPQNYKGAASYKLVNEQYIKLVMGLAALRIVDNKLKQEMLDERIEAIQSYMAQRFQFL